MCVSGTRATRCLHLGRTHQPKAEWFGKTLLLNPGSAGPQRFNLPRAVGTLELIDGKIKPMLIEQFQDAVDDRVLGLGEQVWLRESGLRNTGTGILAAEPFVMWAPVHRINFSTEALGIRIVPTPTTSAVSTATLLTFTSIESRPIYAYVPIMTASTPRRLPILFTDASSNMALKDKCCSSMTFCNCERSMTIAEEVM
jgi:hypothetical protein